MEQSWHFEALRTAWTLLDAASQRVQRVQVSELSMALAELDAAREAMRPLVRAVPPAVPFFAPLLAAWEEMDSAAQNSVIATGAGMSRAVARLGLARIVLRGVFTTNHARMPPRPLRSEGAAPWPDEAFH